MKHKVLNIITFEQINNTQVMEKYIVENESLYKFTSEVVCYCNVMMSAWRSLLNGRAINCVL
jgi:hypothetical protein